MQRPALTLRNEREALGNRDVGDILEVGTSLAYRFNESPLGRRTLTGYVIAPRAVRLGPVAAENRAAGLALYELQRPLTATRLHVLLRTALG
jgi:hypothetical protein